MNRLQTIGIGFVGAGGNTRLRHLPGFAAIDGVRLVTVANRSEASSRKVAAEFGIARTAPDWRAVVADPEVDAVCIGTWPYLHAEVTIAALQAGKHVLTEARMAADLDGARAMLAAARARPDRVAQIVPSPFTLDLDGTVQAILDSGELGGIREVFVAHATGACIDPQAELTWRQDPRYSGVNRLTLGIYHEVIQRWFPDAKMEPTAAAGAVFTEYRTHWESGARVRVELPDALHVLGRMDGRALLNYRFSGVEPGAGRNTIRLVGARGVLRVDVGTGELYRSIGDTAEQPVAVPQAARRGWRVEADFIDSIRNGSPVTLTSFEEGVRYMEFTDAVHRLLVS
jgi:predicted dehydrogenase